MNLDFVPKMQNNSEEIRKIDLLVLCLTVGTVESTSTIYYTKICTVYKENEHL